LREFTSAIKLQQANLGRFISVSGLVKKVCAGDPETLCRFFI
jgi:hypothetical protein